MTFTNDGRFERFLKWKEKKKEVMMEKVIIKSLLVTYIVFILCATVFKIPGNEFQAKLIPFWS